mgnify:CR=1 FL=1|tara:strand:+ start:1257 stop:2255 length:999 start_codon:yes stop_codon:yes gene_type:complete
MSDFGISAARAQSDQINVRGRDAYKAQRAHNSTLRGNLATASNTIKGNYQGTEERDGAKEALTGVEGVGKTLSQYRIASKMGAKGYMAAQVPVAASNIKAVPKGFSDMGANIFDAGTRSGGAGGAGTRATATSVPEVQKTGAQIGQDTFKALNEPNQTKRASGLVQAYGDAAKGEAAAGGTITESMGRKALGAVTDLGETRVGAMAKGLGAAASIAGGVFAAGKDLASGHVGGTLSDGQAVSEASKVANIGSMVAGGLDAAAMAVPILAPVAAVANVADGIAGIIGDISDKHKELTDAAAAEGKNLGTNDAIGTSMSSAGMVATQSATSRTY